jgi:hypothetical protein
MVTQNMGFELLEAITDEMDIVFGAMKYPWKITISRYHYNILKEWEANYLPSWWNRPLFFNKDEHEYIRPIENNNIPFILNYRVVIDENKIGMPTVELDDFFDHDIKDKYKKDYCKVLPSSLVPWE